MIDGRTVMELPRSARSCNEIEALWEYVARRLERVPAHANGSAEPARNAQPCMYDVDAASVELVG
jgi:hypothetical protein